jgi:hypothetical protein
MWLRIPMSPQPIFVLTLKPIFTNESIIEWEGVGGSGILWEKVVIKPDLYQYIRYDGVGLKRG